MGGNDLTRLGAAKWKYHSTGRTVLQKEFLLQVVLSSSHNLTWLGDAKFSSCTLCNTWHNLATPSREVRRYHSTRCIPLLGEFLQQVGLLRFFLNLTWLGDIKLFTKIVVPYVTTWQQLATQSHQVSEYHSTRRTLLHKVFLLRVGILNFSQYLIFLADAKLSSHNLGDDWTRLGVAKWDGTTRLESTLLQKQLLLWVGILSFAHYLTFTKVDISTHLGPLLLTWFNFNPSMDK